MRILAINCGSSSIKCALIDTSDGTRMMDVRLEQIATGAARLQVDGATCELDPEVDFAQAVAKVIATLQQHTDFDAVVHRIVHGAGRFQQPIVIEDSVLGELAQFDDLAPLHNPPALKAVRALRAAWPRHTHVAVFDTAFHATLPRRAREYALPVELCRRLGIRRFGFHGISHAHVTAAAAAHMQRQPQDLRVICCHLGNGASVAAIEYGRSVETSMGMTPLEGLVMGTRSGDLDPGVMLRLLRTDEMSIDSLETLLNEAAGLKGLTGTNDVRDIEARAARGDESCRLAIALFSHRVRKYIGAYAAVMGGVDVIAFTGGIGEHSALLRHRILQRLDFIGIRLNDDRNRDAKVSHAAAVADIADSTSRVRVLIVQADEELACARAAAALLGEGDSVRRSNERIAIAVSARHAHLSQATIERVFGAGYRLQPRTALSQTGQFSAQETVALIGPRGRIDQVRLMGPPRSRDQIEISRSDEFLLGIDAPVRVSGDLNNTPGITLEGPLGRVSIDSGVICAHRHIHASPADARRLGLKDYDTVSVKVDTDGRDLIFGDVTIRVAPDFTLELHLDTDEANAAGLKSGDSGELIL